MLCTGSELADLSKTVQLFDDGQTCPSEGPGPICYNPEEDVPNGPAAPFFAPCAGAAYTYPNGTLIISKESTSRHTSECRMVQSIALALTLR